MPIVRPTTAALKSAHAWAPWSILAGLACVATTFLVTPSFAQTGVALIALGVVASVARHGAMAMLLQLAIYASLYLLFAGAVLHAMDGASRPAILIDLAISAMIMAAQAPLILSSQRATRRR